MGLVLFCLQVYALLQTGFTFRPLIGATQTKPVFVRRRSTLMWGGVQYLGHIDIQCVLVKISIILTKTLTLGILWCWC